MKTALSTPLRLLALLLAGLTVATAQEPRRPRYYYPVPAAVTPKTLEVDVCVYGATPGGVSAAVQTARMGKKVVLVEFGRRVGGMTASGLSYTDGGEPSITGGISAEFYQRLGMRRNFRPSAAESLFRTFLSENAIPLWTEHRLQSVTKVDGRITEARFENGNRVRAKMFIDATYEGDLLAMAGVSFTVGREGNAKYGESINGVIYGPKDNFDVALDPYVIPGDPKSGLIPGVFAEPVGPVGSGDHRVQAYNFRMWLKRSDQGALPWPKPLNYDANRYELLLRFIASGNRHMELHEGDNNNHHMFMGAFFTDLVGENYAWPTADYATREKIYQNQVSYQQGLMYFLANDPRVPDDIRAHVRKFGPANDEFPETGGWPHQLYVREARRMISDYVMTELNGNGSRVAEDSVALASYQMDSHNTTRIVVDGKVTNEGQVYEKLKHPVPLAYRAIVPREQECKNLLVVFAVSASHIGLSTLRMEPVLMITGQSAATAACIAIDDQVPVQKVDYLKLSKRLVSDGQVLTPPADFKSKAIK